MLAVVLLLSLFLTALSNEHHGPREATKPAHRTCTISQELVPSCGAYWGAYSAKGWQSFEDLIGRKLAIVHEYSSWGHIFPTRSETEAANGGSLLYVNWSMRGLRLDWLKIAEGAANAHIEAEATALKAFHHPIMVTYQAEVDQPRYHIYGPPSAFVAAWRHIHNIFAARGVHNVIWVWDVTGDVGLHGWEFPKLYPGDAYVDWIMWDPYNWYGCKPGSPQWRNFTQIVSPMYDWLLKESGTRGNGDYLSKPWGLAEYGTVEGATSTSKEKWFEAEATALPREFPRLKAISYFNTSDFNDGRACRWWVTTSQKSVIGFREAGQSPYVAVMPFAHDSDRLRSSP